MVEEGLQPDLLLNSKYGHSIHFWDLRRRKHVQSIDLGAEYQMALELRAAHDPTKTYGYMGVVESLKDLSGSVWAWHRDNGRWDARKVIEIPAEPADPDQLPPSLKDFKAVLPIALGHMIAVLLVIVLLLLARASLPLKALRIVLVAVLFGYGLYRFIRFRHPGWVGMRVGFRDLTLWSFIMASAHGAGLMLAPVLLGCPQVVQANHDAHLHSAGVNLQAGHSGAFQLGSLAGPLDWIGGVGIHTAGHLIVSALIAFLVYGKTGAGTCFVVSGLTWIFSGSSP